ncbi:MAG: SurA N-terminal domain-containing protein [Rhizomicrobium sp.]|jgi:peptidyl-prolyl cis-trans isomerase D
MLQKMRVYAKSWIAYIFVIPLIAAFSAWGIGDMLHGRAADTSLASVGDEKIEPDDFLRELRIVERNVGMQQEGHVLTGEEAHALGLDHRLLEQQISDKALDQAASHYGLVVSDANVASVIRSEPAFHSALGGFDPMTYQRVLQASNLTEDQYVALIRGDLTRGQLKAATSSGMAAPPGYAKLFFDFLNEHRAADYVLVSEKDLPPTPAPTDSQLTAFMKTHAAGFSTPEYRDITYLSLGPEELAGQLNVTDAQLKQAYDAKRDIYHIPEKRTVEQIIFSNEAGAKAARAKIDAGTSFENVAMAAGKSSSDIGLGSVEQADLGADRGPPTFSLPKGGVTQPIKFTFGWVLLHVTDITPAVNKTFDDVKGELREEVDQQLAGAKISDAGNSFEDARAGGATFAEAAAKAGMRVIHVPAVDKNGMAPDGTKTNLPAAPEFQAQLAKAEVGQEGDPFLTTDGHSYAIKVNGVTPTKLKPLDSVRAQVVAAWTDDLRQRQLVDLAEHLAAKANAQHSLAGVAAEMHATVQASGGLSRKTQSPTLSESAIKAIFSVPAGTAIIAPGASSGTYIVARVTGVQHGATPIGDPRFDQFAKRVGNSAGSDLGETFAKAWRDKLGYSVNQSQIDRIAGGGSL